VHAGLSSGCWINAGCEKSLVRPGAVCPIRGAGGGDSECECGCGWGLKLLRIAIEGLSRLWAAVNEGCSLAFLATFKSYSEAAITWHSFGPKANTHTHGRTDTHLHTWGGHVLANQKQLYPQGETDVDQAQSANIIMLCAWPNFAESYTPENRTGKPLI